jgi:hypothetical protein
LREARRPNKTVGPAAPAEGTEAPATV